MLATTFLALGLATSAAAALDLLLGDAQKQYIADTTVRLWNWLDDAKRLSFLRWLKQRRFQIAYAVAVNVVITAAVGIYVWKETYLPQAPSIMDGWVVVIASLALVIFLFSLVGIIGIIKTMQADSANRILLRAAGFTSVSLLPPIVSWLWLSNITVKGIRTGTSFWLCSYLLR